MKASVRWLGLVALLGAVGCGAPDITDTEAPLRAVQLKKSSFDQRGVNMTSLWSDPSGRFQVAIAAHSYGGRLDVPVAANREVQTLRVGVSCRLFPGKFATSTRYEAVQAGFLQRKAENASPLKPDQHPELVAAIVETCRRKLNALASQRFEEVESRHLYGTPLRTGKTEDALYGEVIPLARSKGWSVRHQGSRVAFKRGGSKVAFDIATAYARVNDSWVPLPDVVICKDGVYFAPLAGLDLLR